MRFNVALKVTAAAAALALVLGLGASRLLPVDKLYSHSTYYFLWATCLCLFAAVRGGQDPAAPSLVRRWRQWLPLLGLALVLTGLTFICVGVDFRVLTDESNLISTSRSLFLNRTVENLLQGEPYYGYWGTLESGLPTRPALFPFLVNIFHTLVGFNPYHGFVLNFVCGIGMVFVFVRFGRQMVDTSFGVIAAVLLAAFPLYELVITSSGYDAVNLFCVMVVYWLLYDFLQAATARKLEVLLLVTVLAGQCRYESILLVAPVGVAALLRWRTLVGDRFSWRFPLIPLLLLPITWQRIAMGLNTLQQDGRTDVFRAYHTWPNLVGAYNLLLNPMKTTFPRSNIIMALALIGIGLFIHTLWKRRLKRSVLEGAAVIALGTALIMATHLSFYMGDISAAYQMRMGLVYLGLISLAAAYPLRLAMDRGVTKETMAVLLGVLFLHELPVAAHNEVGKSLLLYREFHDANTYLKTIKRPFVVISDWPVIYTSMGYGSMSYDYVKNNPDKLKRSLKMHLYEVYAVQIVPEDRPPKQSLPRTLVGESVAEYQNDANTIVRVARVSPAIDEVHIKGRKAVAE